MNAINTTMSPLQWMLIVILSLIWGASFFFMEIILTQLSSFELVFYRLLFAAIMLWIIVIIRGMYKRYYNNYLKEFIIMGFFNNAVPFSLIAWGQEHISGSLASIFNAAMPFFTVLISYFLLSDECITKRKILGVMVGFVGVAYAIGFGALNDLGESSGQFAVLLAGVSYAIATTYGRRFRQYQVNPTALATIQITIATIILAIYIIVSKHSFIISPNATVFASMVGLSVLSTAFAYIIYFYILENAGALNISLVTFLVPISAIGLGTLLLGESLETHHIIGGFGIIVGLIIIDGRVFIRK